MEQVPFRANILESACKIHAHNHGCAILYGTVKERMSLFITVPDSMVLQILTERLCRLDCTACGWVLHGFPQDVEQAERLQESNFLPSRYVQYIRVTN